MIQLFSGVDTYESYQACKTYLSKISSDTKFPVKVIDADDVKDPREVMQEIEGIGLFSDESVVFLKRLFKNKNLSDFFSEKIAYLNHFQIVIWEDNKVDGKLKLYKKLKQSNAIYEFPELKEYEIKNWINLYLKSFKFKLSSANVDFIISRLGLNKWRIVSELEKLKIYMETTQQSNITEEILSNIMGFDVSGDIWKFLEYFGDRNRKKCLKEFEKITTFENNVQYLIAMITRELEMYTNLLLSEKYNVSAESMGIHPFVLKKAREKYRNFSYTDLFNFTKKLFQLDYAIKSGKIEEKLGMTTFLLML